MKLNSELKNIISGVHLRQAYINGLDIAKINNNLVVVVWGEHGDKI